MTEKALCHWHEKKQKITKKEANFQIYVGAFNLQAF